MSLQGPGSQNSPENAADLGAVIRKMNDRLEKLERGSMLKPAGISVAPEGMTIDSSLTVNGDLTTSGDTVIGGNAAIVGTLSLPAGIIDNDALANPIEFVDAVASDVANGYGTSYASLAVCTLAIPAGFSKFTFSGAGVARCYNSSGVTVYLYVQTYSKVVGSTDAWGSACQDTITNAFQSTVTAPHSVTHTIPGGSTHVQMWVNVKTTSAVASDPSNFVGIEGIALFTR